mgnify:CR=1 FL=1
MCVCLCVFVFFVQAEDGIRDLVRSRGLGDVYKRQALECSKFTGIKQFVPDLITDFRTLEQFKHLFEIPIGIQQSLYAVSYTHLTLPTSDLV